VSDAEGRLKQHVLAALPLQSKAARGSLAWIFVNEPQSLFSEGIRTARTGVMLSSLDLPRKTILVTSSVPGEGKTTVAINLALAHAQTKPTLLIDCDLRRSRVGRALGLDPTQKGLTNLVAGTAPMSECVTMLKETGLMVMPVGDVPPNPLELLLSQRFNDVLRMLSEQFDVIVIDSPPVELVSDALVLAPQVTSVVYVVRAMRTPVPLVRKNITQLQRAGGHLLGVIVNQLDFKASRRYHGEYGADGYTDDSYGYGYGYGQNKQSVYGAGSRRNVGSNDGKGGTGGQDGTRGAGDTVAAGGGRATLNPSSSQLPSPRDVSDLT
jgi:capsular exopolysaccharide synthesis family protein